MTIARERLRNDGAIHGQVLVSLGVKEPSDLLLLTPEELDTVAHSLQAVPRSKLKAALAALGPVVPSAPSRSVPQNVPQQEAECARCVEGRSTILPIHLMSLLGVPCVRIVRRTDCTHLVLHRRYNEAYFSNAAKAAHDTTKKQLRSPIDQGLVHTWNEGRALEERVTNSPQSTASRTQMALAPHRAIQKPTRKIRATTRCMEEMRLPAITVADIDERLDFYVGQKTPGVSQQLCCRYLKEMGVAYSRKVALTQLRQRMRVYLANGANRGVSGTGASATFRPLNGAAPLCYC